MTTYDQNPATPTPPPAPGRGIFLALVGLGTIAVLAAGAFVAVQVLQVVAGEDTITTTGQMQLYSDGSSYSRYYDDAYTVSGNTCVGNDGFSDIHQSTFVTVKNASGEIVATSNLKQGYVSGGACNFDFDVTVPVSDFYAVQVSNHNRGEVTYTDDQMQDGPIVTLNVSNNS